METKEQLSHELRYNPDLKFITSDIRQDSEKYCEAKGLNHQIRSDILKEVFGDIFPTSCSSSAFKLGCATMSMANEVKAKCLSLGYKNVHVLERKSKVGQRKKSLNNAQGGFTVCPDEIKYFVVVNSNEGKIIGSIPNALHSQLVEACEDYLNYIIFKDTFGSSIAYVVNNAQAAKAIEIYGMRRLDRIFKNIKVSSRPLGLDCTRIQFSIGS